MKIPMKAALLAVSAGLLTMMAQAAPRTAVAESPPPGDIRWEADPATGKAGAPRLTLRDGSSRSSLALDGGRRELGDARAALGRDGAGPVSFAVIHAAGTLACSGRLTRAYAGEGRCRFTSDPAFERQLADRGLALDGRGTPFAMLLVDATIELADGLRDAGIRTDDAGDLIAAAAMKVTPAYVRDINAGPVRVASVSDAIAFKALGIDADFVLGLAQAGYDRLSADEVMGMKAMGVTPGYARAMNAAAVAAR